MQLDLMETALVIFCSYYKQSVWRREKKRGLDESYFIGRAQGLDISGPMRLLVSHSLPFSDKTFLCLFVVINHGFLSGRLLILSLIVSGLIIAAELRHSCGHM